MDASYQSGYLSRPRADQVKFKSPPVYRRSMREMEADLSALAKEKELSERSIHTLNSPSDRKIWTSLDCPGGDETVPNKRIQAGGDWKTPFPPYAIDLTRPSTLKNPVVEEILSATTPPPKVKTHSNSGKPVTKIGREAAHPAIVRKNGLGGFFTG